MHQPDDERWSHELKLKMFFSFSFFLNKVQHGSVFYLASYVQTAHMCCICYMTFGTKLTSRKGPTAVAIHFLTPSMSYIIMAFVCLIMVCWLDWEITQVQLFRLYFIPVMFFIFTFIYTSAESPFKDSRVLAACHPSHHHACVSIMTRTTLFSSPVTWLWIHCNTQDCLLSVVFQP